MIFLKKEEDISLILKRLDAARSKFVIFNFPSKSKIFEMKSWLRILKEEAEHLGKNIAIETDDEKGIKLCQNLGIETYFPNQGENEESENIRNEAELKIQEVKNENWPESLRLTNNEQPSGHLETWFKNGKKKSPDGEMEEKKSWILRPLATHFLLSIFILSFSVFVLTILFILPRVDVNLKLKEEVIEDDLKITAKKDSLIVDQTGLVIPAVVFSQESSKKIEFEATGKKEAEEKASGRIEVFNAYNSKPQTLVATTRFESKDGKIFRMIKAATIPAATIKNGQLTPSSVFVEVRADKPGEEYNIGPSDFTIPGFAGSDKFKGFYGKSRQAMEGGAQGKINFITEEDIKKASEFLKNDLAKEATTSLKSKISSPLDWIPGADEIVVSESNISQAGKIGPKGSAFMKIVFQAIVFDQNDLNRLVDEKLKNKIKNNERLVPEISDLAFSGIAKNFEKGILTFSVNVKAKKTKLIDQDRLIEELKGQSEADIKNYFSSKSDILAAASVNYWPFWVSHIPKFSKSINLIIEPKY